MELMVINMGFPTDSIISICDNYNAFSPPLSADEYARMETRVVKVKVRGGVPFT